MAYTLTQARNLLTAAELTLFQAGRATEVKALTPAQLRAKVQRTRKLRDKYRDLFKRQRLAARERTGSKGGRSGVANARSKEKAVLFGELLERFQKRLAQVEAAGKKAAAKKPATRKPAAKRSAAGAARKASPRKAATKKTAKKPAKKATRKAAKKAAGKTAGKTAGKPAGKKTGKASKARTTARKSTIATTAKKAGETPAAGKAAKSGAVGRAHDLPRKLADVTGADASPVQGGYVSGKARSTALERRLAESRTRPIQAHISSSGRRNQARRDRRRG